MKQVRAEKIDSVEDYRLIDVPEPVPGPAEVLIKVKACAMGYVDALVALGGYQVKPPVPFTPGQEFAGVVAAIGSGVTGLAVGDRVLANGFGGGLAEQVALPAAMVTRIPDALGFAEAAGFKINYLTALHGLMDRAFLQPGERLLVMGAAGGVGSAAVQVGRLLGAEVIAVASTPEKRAFVAGLGAVQVLDTEAEGWRERVKAACGGKGPDVVFDPVAGPLFETAFRSLAWRGRHLVVGFTGGPIPKLPINLSLMKGAALVGVDVRQFMLFEPALAARHLDQLFDWAAQGALVPPLGRQFALADFAEAMRFAMSGKGVGKAIVTMSPLAG